MNNILHYMDETHDQNIEKLQDFLNIASVSTDHHYQKDVESCAVWLFRHLESIGFQTVEKHTTPGHPIITAKAHYSDDLPTLLLYGHYDVQPPDPLELWETPPFTATIRDGALYARGVADDKGQVFCHLNALEAFFKVNGKFPVNITCLIEGEEEIGSPNLLPFLEQNKEFLKADYAVVSDSPMFDADTPSIATSLRGLLYYDLTATGPSSDLHSGQMGGVVQNPIQALSSIITQLKDANHHVTIPNFYDDVDEITPEIKATLSALPHHDAQLKNTLGVDALGTEKDYSALECLWYRPTLDCNGIIGGYTKEGAKTVIPSKAHAKISCRLVASQNPDKINQSFKDTIAKLTPPGITVEVTEHHRSEAIKIDSKQPIFDVAKQAYKQVHKKEAIFQGEGGSIPIVSDFKRILGLDTVLMGFNLPDDNIHAPNEKMGLKQLKDGSQVAAWFYNLLV